MQPRDNTRKKIHLCSHTRQAGWQLVGAGDASPVPAAAMEDSETEAAETDPLVKQGRGQPPPGLWRRRGNGGGPAAGERQGVTTLTAGLGSPLFRKRVKRAPRRRWTSTKMDTRREQDAKKAAESPTPLCPFFGVKNYLHHFYEKQDISNPALYEDAPMGMEQVFLVKQGGERLLLVSVSTFSRARRPPAPPRCRCLRRCRLRCPPNCLSLASTAACR
ncbi:uncharacterized protein LOC135105949 isoform X2 [Scylla paramamosain]|uniref:uncharacterized protein LOC135105949 isoform X2 n=1 Tax=Scylla paramamosain TaxID=85552 RepID=UPI003082E1EB